MEIYVSTKRTLCPLHVSGISSFSNLKYQYGFDRPITVADMELILNLLS